VNSQFDDFLRRRQIQRENLSEVLKNRMNQWLAALKSLYQSVNSFLQPYLDSKRVETILSDYDISENKLGNYCVETMKIVIPGNVTVQAQLVPVGTYILGGRGRVDLISPTVKDAKLLFVPANMTSVVAGLQFIGILSGNDKTKPVAEEIEWAWKILTPPPDLLLLELNEKNFFDALVYVMEG
jgi:hypothetical protein